MRSASRLFDPTLGLRLIDVEESREEVIARAKLLVADAGYPPPQVLDAIADLMARHVHG